MRGGGGSLRYRGGPQLCYIFRGRRGNSACPRFCKRTILFCTQVQSMGGGNPLTIHEIYAALTPSDSQFAAAKQVEDYKI